MASFEGVILRIPLMARARIPRISTLSSPFPLAIRQSIPFLVRSPLSIRVARWLAVVGVASLPLHRWLGESA